MPDYTIIIPYLLQPNYLSVCLRGLVKHSVLNPQILIIGSDPTELNGATKDFAVNPQTLATYRKYELAKEFLSKQNLSWMADNNIRYIDVTDEAERFWLEYRAGRIWPDKFEPLGGPDTAFKDNMGMRYVETEWVMQNWDADFYPGPEWDRYLFEAVESTAKMNKIIFVPTHVQKRQFDSLPDIKDIWEDLRQEACHYLPWPTTVAPVLESRGMVGTLEKEWIEFYLKWKRSGTITEPPGIRDRLHWVPTLFKTTEFKDDIGPYCYMGSGYDLEMESRLAEKGYIKVSHQSSFILHKGAIAYTPDEI